MCSSFFGILVGLFSLQAQQPATEVRAVWLSPNWNLDWPSSPQLSVEAQKKELCQILDTLAYAHFNTLFFQVRLRGNVFYKSAIEHWNPAYTWSKTLTRDSDPLSFAIAECHRRGIECHAWFVVYPLGKKEIVAKQPFSVVNTHPSMCKLHEDQWYLDPGNPDAQRYILSLVNELVTNYDIDGLNLDYIRYPQDAKSFGDQKTYRQYGNGKSLDDWRRDNITTLVAAIYDAVKAQKPWVQVSSSPLGKYKPLNPNDGWTAYYDVMQDVGKWLTMGKQDAIYPMMYYQNKLFYPYADDWVRRANGRIVVPGLGVYRLSADQGNWNEQLINNQIDYIRAKKMAGEAYYRVGNLMKNEKGILSSIKTYYRYPSKLPPMLWLDSIAPSAPHNLQVFRTTQGLTCIRWDIPPHQKALTYTVYQSATDSFDKNNERQILATNIHGNYLLLAIPYSQTGTYYAVSASTRYHNESAISFSAYFVHTKEKR